VYIAPLKALARERLKEWSKKLGKGLGMSVLELSGDVTPDVAMLKRADIIVATPEKWDGITRRSVGYTTGGVYLRSHVPIATDAVWLMLTARALLLLSAGVADAYGDGHDAGSMASAAGRSATTCPRCTIRVMYSRSMLCIDDSYENQAIKHQVCVRS
jgi:hypothetical protein